MPSDTPLIKKNAVKGYNAEVIECGPTVREQEETSSRVAKEKDAELIHPYNDLQIITGAATCAAEIFEDVQTLDYLVVPVGGGGLSSGTLLATHYFSPKTVVIGVEPYLARDAK
jgi:threonine dehydratase